MSMMNNVLGFFRDNANEITQFCWAQEQKILPETSWRYKLSSAVVHTTEAGTQYARAVFVNAVGRKRDIITYGDLDPQIHARFVEEARVKGVRVSYVAAPSMAY